MNGSTSSFGWQVTNDPAKRYNVGDFVMIISGYRGSPAKHPNAMAQVLRKSYDAYEKTIYDLWFGGMYCWSYSPSSLRKVTWVGRGPQPKLEDVNRHLSRSFPSIVNWFYFDRFEYSPEADDARWPSLYDVGMFARVKNWDGLNHRKATGYIFAKWRTSDEANSAWQYDMWFGGCHFGTYDENAIDVTRLPLGCTLEEINRLYEERFKGIDRWIYLYCFDFDHRRPGRYIL